MATIQDVRSIKVIHHGPSQGDATQTAEPTRPRFRQRHSFEVIRGLQIICQPRQRFRQRHSFEVIQGLYIICQPRHAQMLVRLHVVPVLIFSYFGMLLGEICLFGAAEGKRQSHVHAADNPG